MTTPEEFEQTWLPRLTQEASVLFRCGTPPKGAITHTSAADAFVRSLGLKPIGFNWELLDASADAQASRSAVGEITKAISSDLANPSQLWLAPDVAQSCAQDFLNLFDAADLTVVSNRHDGLWNPIAGGEVEWGFVGYDRHKIALLLLVAQ
ncbi:MAG: hypothetical protein AAFQ27_15515 [Pseudomonadota bacterium]